MRGESWISLAKSYMELAWEGMLPDSKTSVAKVKSLLIVSISESWAKIYFEDKLYLITNIGIEIALVLPHWSALGP